MLCYSSLPCRERSSHFTVARQALLAALRGRPGAIDAARGRPPQVVRDQPIYTPPKKITPRARVGGDVRGTDGTDPEVKALVPDHVGLTIKETPA